MSKTVIHIWGPLGIQSYGLFVVIGILVATWLFLKNPKTKSVISKETFNKVLIATIVSGIVGGRLLYIFEDPQNLQSLIDIFKVWHGGLSSLGAIAAILLIVPLYLKKLKVPIIPFLDLIAIYAPLIYAIARIGCFFAGCCYGTQVNLPWAVTYTDITSSAPLGITLHPAQLYSSIASFCIFLLLYFVLSKKLQKPGQLLFAYLMLASLERFSIDLVRGDRTFFSSHGLLSKLSTSGWISLLIFFISLITLAVIPFKKTKSNG